MNSFNHYSFGAIGEWLMSHSAGIRRTAPGFKTFELRPEIDLKQEITWVRAHYDSPYGRITSHWKVTGEQLTYYTTIPANNSAMVHLPPVIQAIHIDGEPMSVQPSQGVLLGSGKYDISGTIVARH